MIHLRKPKFKANKKVILISTISTIVLTLFIFPLYFNAGLVEILEESLSIVLASLIRGIGFAISSLINGMEVGIDKLVFNVENNFSDPTILKNANISLLKNNTLSTQLFNIYTLFVYIATVVLSVMGIWITIDFIKTAEDVKHIAVLKDRLKKLIISIALLTSIPMLFDEMMIINQVIIDIFRLVIIDSVGGSQFDGLFLSDVFKTMSESQPGDIILACIYLISTFLNGWLVIFYMIRDLAISLLFIIAPIIAVLLPYRTDLVLKWFKEMASNIFTQAIQAMILAIVVMIASTLSTSEGIYDRIFALVAFCSFIPLTAAVKKALGLEGEIGAAKSNAGVGAMVGAMALAGATYKSAKGTVGKIKGYNQDIRNIGAEEALLKKSDFEANQVGGPMRGQTGGVQGDLGKLGGSEPSNTPSPSGTDGGGRGIGIDPNNRSASNRNFGVDVQGDYDSIGNGGYTATSRARQLQGMKANARKQRNKAILGSIGGAFGGALMGLGAAAYGNPVASVLAARTGSDIGSDLGEITGEQATNLAQGVNEVRKDRKFGEGIRYDGEQNPELHSLFEGATLKSTPKEVFEVVKSNRQKNKEIIKYNKKDGLAEAQLRATGLDPTTMSEKDFNTEKAAILRRNTLERKGAFSMAHRSYARNTYKRGSSVGKSTSTSIVPTNNIPSDLAKTPNPNIPTRPGGAAAVRPILEESKNLGLANVSSQMPINNEVQKVENAPIQEKPIQDNNSYDDMFGGWDYLNNDLNSDILNYQNNNDYLSVLDEIYSNIDKPHIGSDNSQLT